MKKKKLQEKQEILPKKIHAITLTHNDIIENLRKKDPAIIDIIKNAVILYGEDRYVEVLSYVTSF